MYVSLSVLPFIGMSVAAFVPSVSLSFYWPILSCHTSRVILPLPLDPMCLPSCSAPLSHFLIFHSCNFRFFIFVRLLLLFYLNFTINLSARNFFPAAFSFPLKRSVFISVLHFSVYCLPRRFIFAQIILVLGFLGSYR
jgi:hypothetical protein